MIETRQLEVAGEELAGLIHTILAWEEPLDGDAVDTVVEAFEDKLKELNGVVDDD